MESYIIEENTAKSSRLPARLDLAQSATGLILGLFMWVHMLLVGSIILGKDAFDFVAKTMELAFLSDTGHGYPIAVFFAVSGVFTLFILHALLGVRKFPITWRQHRIIRDQMQMMKHTDTNLWYIQVVTGFIMFFFGSVHLYTMLVNPGSIDPFLSADRVVSGNFWFLYLVLLICVELHASIGLYRLCMKWGWFGGKDARHSRKKLKTLKNRLTIFFLAIGFLALLMFIVIGWGHRQNAGERYHGTAYQKSSANAAVQQQEEPAAPADEAAAPADEAAAPADEAVPAVEEMEKPQAEEDVIQGSAQTEDAALDHDQVPVADDTASHGSAAIQDAGAQDTTAQDAAGNQETADSHGAEDTASDAHDTTHSATETQ
ncbi:MAG: fumarate reductase cytochrome b subunit [Desulfotignum sp.]